MSDGQPPFPIVDQADFDRHPKSRKRKDVERMLLSGASEDWVTWTAFRLLQSHAPDYWWANLVTLAKADNPALLLPQNWEETPEILLWQTIPSPAAYETASRMRMRNSDDTELIARSHGRKPVEGKSEIDMILRNRALLVFVEAKLGSDIAERTTYDPSRNQIVRNIDCLLDQPGNRVPMFWLVVRDKGQDRLYMKTVNLYRTEPDALVRELRHHDAARIVAVIKRLSVILWKDLLDEVVGISETDGEKMQAIKAELRRRIGGG